MQSHCFLDPKSHKNPHASLEVWGWAVNLIWKTFSYFVQLLSPIQLFATPWTAAHQASLSFAISRSLLKLMSIESMMPSTHLILCRPLQCILFSIELILPQFALSLTCEKHVPLLSSNSLFQRQFSLYPLFYLSSLFIKLSFDNNP